MRNPELNDSLSDYSAADRAIIRAALNKSRLDNKKGAAKKTVTKKVEPKKAAPKPTDSRFTGKLSGTGSPAKPKSGAGSMAYTPGSAKSGKATYTTGSGVKYTPSSTKVKNLAAEVAAYKSKNKNKSK